MTRENAKELLPVMRAWVEGKTVQYQNKGDLDWTDLFNAEGGWFTDLDIRKERQFRIKPEPKLRPWRPEEVPVGAWLRCKQNSAHYNPKLLIGLILGCDTDALQTINRIFNSCKIELETFQFVFENGEHSLDHGRTWLPCGVEE